VEEKTMHTIETMLTVTDKGEILVPAIADLPPGEHKAVLVIEEEPAQPTDSVAKLLSELRTFPIEGWSANTTYSRQEIYDDDGR
jgi:hypothetical protein